MGTKAGIGGCLMTKRTYHFKSKESRERRRQCMLGNKINLGRKRTQELKEKISGEKHYLWKGDSVSYKSMHEWVRNHLHKPNRCPFCDRNIELEVAYIDDTPNGDYSSYKRDLWFWRWTCTRCHMRADQRARRRKNKVM